MDFPIVVIWINPLSFLGAAGGNFSSLFHFSMNFMSANRIARDGTPHFAASHLGIFSLPMSHKKDAYMG